MRPCRRSTSHRPVRFSVRHSRWLRRSLLLAAASVAFFLLNGLDATPGRAASPVASAQAPITPLSSLFLDIGALSGGGWSTVRAVGEGGHVVGASQTTTGEGHAYIWTSSAGIQDLGVLNDGEESVATGVNALGQVVGTSGTRAFFWSAGTGMVDLGFDYDATPTAISNGGHIIGTYTIPDDPTTYGFYWTADEGFYDLGFIPTVVNSRGEVGGTYTWFEGDSQEMERSSAFYFSSSDGSWDLARIIHE
jgi:probable HAF family extracellular repeat protein